MATYQRILTVRKSLLHPLEDRYWAIPIQIAHHRSHQSPSLSPVSPRKGVFHPSLSLSPPVYPIGKYRKTQYSSVVSPTVYSTRSKNLSPEFTYTNPPFGKSLFYHSNTAMQQKPGQPQSGHMHVHALSPPSTNQSSHLDSPVAHPGVAARTRSEWK